MEICNLQNFYTGYFIDSYLKDILRKLYTQVVLLSSPGHFVLWKLL